MTPRVAAALAVSTASSPADYGRDVIYRATINVAAADVAAATREAVAIVEGLGGIVFGQQVRTRPQPRTDMTFKVRPEDFSLILERLAGVGELVDQQISADDVTERIVNFESRILTAQVSVLRLRKFLEEATNIDNVALPRARTNESGDRSGDAPGPVAHLAGPGEPGHDHPDDRSASRNDPRRGHARRRLGC